MLGCKLDDCREHMVSSEWISTEKMRANCEKRFINIGKHVRYMLGKVSDFLRANAGPEIRKLTFDSSNGKLPSFEVATDVEVLPVGLE